VPHIIPQPRLLKRNMVACFDIHSDVERHVRLALRHDAGWQTDCNYSETRQREWENKDSSR